MQKKRYSVEQIVAVVRQHEAGMSVAEAETALRDVLYIDGKWHKHRLDVDWSAAEALIRRVGPNVYILGIGSTALVAALCHEHVPLPLAHRLVTEFGLPTDRGFFPDSLDVRAYLLIVHDNKRPLKLVSPSVGFVVAEACGG